MNTTPSLVAAIVVSMLSCGAHADGITGDDKRLTRLDDPKTVRASRSIASADDAKKQERLSKLQRHPRAPAQQASSSKEAHFLIQAAASGETESMLKLADGLNKGALGLKKLPDAARCWSGRPADFDSRLACLSLTDFRNPRARVPCNDLTSMREGLPPGRTMGVTMARLCLANKTPALLVPGPPPGEYAIERGRLYAQHGIALVVTGDVYEEAFEKYRSEFNNTIVADLEAKRGQGYMEKLSNDIDARMSRQDRDRK